MRWPAPNTFGARLRQARIAQQMTQGELAGAAGLAQQCELSKYELNLVEPNFARLLRICEALGVTPNDLLLSSRL
jgi:transcriptional regulator with XRE-family HTH domain